MGLSEKLSLQLEAVFNQWSKVPIGDQALKQLIQLSLVPRKEVLTDLEKERTNGPSTCLKHTCEPAFAYAMCHESQQLPTTKGTLFGAYNAITGYFQNVRTYKSDEAKLKSLLYGGTAQLKTQKAFQLCADFAANGVLALN